MTLQPSAIDPLLAPLMAGGLILACVGWGTLLFHFISSRHEAPPSTSSRAMAGLGAMVALGGFVILGGWFGRPVALGLLAPSLLALSQLVQQRRALFTDARGLGWGLLGWCACAALWLAWLFIPAAINGNDDGTGYLAFTHKLIETGGFGLEPFSERRLFGLGGHQMFLAIVLSFLPERWAGIVEPCFGMALTILVLRDAGKHWRTPPLVLSLLAFLLLGTNLAGSTILANLMPTYLLVALTTYLVCTAVGHQRSELTRWETTVAGLTLAALITFRTTSLPVGGALILLYLASTARRRWPARALQIACAAAVLLVPYMLCQLQSSHTLLFPFLGRGWHGSATSDFPSPNAGFTKAQLARHMLVAFGRDPLAWLTAAVAVLALRRRSPERIRLFLAAFACLATDLLIGYATGGTSTQRYAFPFFVGFLLIAPQVLGIRPLQLPRAALLTGGLAPFALIAAVVAARPHQIRAAVADRVAVRWKAAVPRPEELRAYRQAQELIPAGARILAHATRAYLLDFKRNPIWLNDQPGAAGPPPGWPRNGGSAEVRAYLRSAGIQYVLITTSLLTDPPAPSTDDHWHRNLDRAEQRWIGALNGPAFSPHQVYRDAELTVFALEAP